MTDEHTIRLLTEADLPAYKALRDAGLRSEPAAFTSDYESARDLPASSYAARLGRPPDDHFMLGAFDGAGALVGAVACLREPRAKVRHVAELVGMIVEPSMRGRGIGAALLREFERQVRQLPGVEQVTLSVTAGNAAAEALYAAAGFARYGLLARAIRVGGRYHDKALMVKAL